MDATTKKVPLFNDVNLFAQFDKHGCEPAAHKIVQQARQRKIDAEEAQSWVVSLNILLSLSIGTDSETGAFAVHEERIKRIVALVESLATGLSDAARNRNACEHHEATIERIPGRKALVCPHCGEIEDV